MRQVRVQGCLPTLLVLAVVLALGVVAVVAGLSVLVATAVLLLILAAARASHRLLGRAPPPAERPLVEEVPPGWTSLQDGPIVDADPRDSSGKPGPSASEPDPEGAGERTLPPRG